MDWFVLAAAGPTVSPLVTHNYPGPLGSTDHQARPGLVARLRCRNPAGSLGVADEVIGAAMVEIHFESGGRRLSPPEMEKIRTAAELTIKELLNPTNLSIWDAGLLADRGGEAAAAELRARTNAGNPDAACQLIRLLVRQGDEAAVAELRARADAGDRDAAGRLGELLAERGDHEGALRVWARAYGRDSPRTGRLAGKLAGRGDLDGAVSAWGLSDAVYQNPAGVYQEFRDRLADLEVSELDRCQGLTTPDPEDWLFTEVERLAGVLARRGDNDGIMELWEYARSSDPAVDKRRAGLLGRWNVSIHESD